MKGKTRNILVFVFILVLIVIVFLEIWLNKDYLNNLIGKYVQRFGYLGIFVFSLLADLLEQPIGPEVSASLGVIFELNIFLILVFSVLGSWGGSLISYYIGKKYFHHRLKDIAGGKIKEKYYRLFENYGRPILALAAISPIPWVTFCWLAGGFKLKIRHFIFWGLIPRLLRISLIAGILWYVTVLV